MANILKPFDSVGGFSVDKNVLVDSDKNIISANTLEIQNKNFSDAYKKNYILRGTNTSVMALDNVNTQIRLESNTVNFITSYVVGVNDSGTANYFIKFESAVQCNSVGFVSLLSSMKTIIKDTIPIEETWGINEFISNTNSFSYSVLRSGTIATIKWIASTEVVSISI